jgi:hypothetical protein
LPQRQGGVKPLHIERVSQDLQVDGRDAHGYIRRLASCGASVGGSPSLLV